MPRRQVVLRVENRRLTDTSIANADDPQFVGNLEFSLRSANGSYTDHAARLRLQLNGVTQSHWNTTIASIVDGPDAPHINAQFTGLSPYLQGWIIDKFDSQH